MLSLICLLYHRNYKKNTLEDVITEAWKNFFQFSKGAYTKYVKGSKKVFQVFREKKFSPEDHRAKVSWHSFMTHFLKITSWPLQSILVLYIKLSRWRYLSYMPCKSMDWFPYDRNLRHEKVKACMCTDLKVLEVIFSLVFTVII